MDQSRLVAPVLAVIALIAGGCSASKSHEFRAARHVEIAQHAFILQGIEDCKIADAEERGKAHYRTAQQMTAYIGHLSGFMWTDMFDDEEWARQDWDELGKEFPVLRSAVAATESGEAANRLPLLLDDEWVRVSIEGTHRITTSRLGGTGIDRVIIEQPDQIPISTEQGAIYSQAYRVSGTVEIDGPYGFAGFEISGTMELSEFIRDADGQLVAAVTDLDWTMVAPGHPTDVWLAPGEFDSRIRVDEQGLGEVRLIVAFHSPQYPYLDDIYFNTVLNLPVTTSPEFDTLALATPGSVRGYEVAPVRPLPAFDATAAGGCADENANGIPDYLEAQNRSLERVREILLEPY
ncbi:MAG: hypothetical protein NXI14_01440 [bacterium]|nr:hypothetical protein [bacterium]